MGLEEYFENRDFKELDSERQLRAAIRFAQFGDFSTDLSKSSNPLEAVELTVDFLYDKLKSSFAGVARKFDDKTGRFSDYIMLPRNIKIPAKVLRTARSHFREGTYSDNLHNGNPDEPYDGTFYYYLPITGAGRAEKLKLGMLVVGRASKLKLSEKLVLAQVPPNLGNVLARCRSDEESINAYGLENAFNKTYFKEQINNEIKKSKKHKTPLYLMFVDLDLFKQINDSYGHPIGNKVIEQLVTILNEHGPVYRYGGDEFALVLTPDMMGLDKKDSNLADSVVQYARGIRDKVRSHDFGLPLHEDAPQKVTVSIGIGMMHPKDSYAELEKRADKALYDVKGTGRDDVRMR